MAERKFKIVINGKEYTRVEDVPQPLRWLIQKSMDAAAARGITGLPGPAEPAPPSSGPGPIQPVRSSVLPFVACGLALLGWLAYRFALAGR